MTLLGISVGATRTGVAVLRDGTLLDRHVHSYQASWNDLKLRIIVNRYHTYIRRFQITDIVVKVPPPCRQSKAVQAIVKRIQSLARDCRCSFDLTTKSELKEATGAVSTKELILCATQLYPELAATYQVGTRTRHEYSKKLFEAVLAAHFYQERLRRRAGDEA